MKVTNVEELKIRLEQVKKAQQIFSTYTQEQVDEIFRQAAMAANDARIELAKLAVEETGMGIVEDKVIKTILLLNIFITSIGMKRPAA